MGAELALPRTRLLALLVLSLALPGVADPLARVHSATKGLSTRPTTRYAGHVTRNELAQLVPQEKGTDKKCHDKKVTEKRSK